jgi:plastocyanin
MIRSFLAAAAVAALALTVATTALGRPAGTPVLNGVVGPGFTISLKQNGKAVKTLKAGKYKFVIADKASIHAFSLDGPHGFAKDFTTVSFTGTKTVTLTLKAGKYKYYCPPHESSMFAHFTVR